MPSLTEISGLPSSQVSLLRLNGWHFVTEAAEGVASMEGLASGEVSEEKFKAGWAGSAKSNNISYLRVPISGAY